MKAVTISEAQGQLKQLIAKAYDGELVVLKDGDKQVTLEPRMGLNLEEDSPELEIELLKAVNGHHAPFSENELHVLAEKALTEYRTRRQK